MKKALALLVLVVLALSLVSCVSLNAPVSATSNEVGAKVGQASGLIWFGVFGNVDAGIQAAAQDGGILEISTVDFEVAQTLFGPRFTTTVTGK